MGSHTFNAQQLVLLLAVIALVIAIVFHVMYLWKDRHVETAYDEYLKNNALMFFGMSVALAVVGMLWGKHRISLHAHARLSDN